MRRQLLASAAGITLAIAAAALLQWRGLEALAQTAPAPAPSAPATPPAPAAPAVPTAAAPAAPAAAGPAAPVADTTAYYVNVVDLDIAPGSMPRFISALKDDVAGTMSEAGVHEIDTTVASKDPNNVFIYELYNNSAAWDSHQKTATYVKFLGLTMITIRKYNIRPFSSLVLYKSTAAPPSTPPSFINVVELDIAPDQFNNFKIAAQGNAALAVQDPGVREFNISVSATDPHHLMFFEVYDNAAAHQAHVATDHFKAYQAATKEMVAARTVTQYTTLSLNAKN